MNIIAAIDLDALLPLIVGVFWVVAQLVGAAAKKKTPPPRPSHDEPAEDKDPLADLMRKLGGAQEFKIPEPPEPAPAADAMPSLRSHKTESTAKTPQPQKTSPLPALKPVKIEDIQKPDFRPSMKSFKTVMPSMKLPAMNLSFRGAEPAGGRPEVGKIIDPADRNTLRRAMLGHIILEKPKGL